MIEYTKLIIICIVGIIVISMVGIIFMIIKIRDEEPDNEIELSEFNYNDLLKEKLFL